MRFVRTLSAVFVDGGAVGLRQKRTDDVSRRVGHTQSGLQHPQQDERRAGALRPPASAAGQDTDAGSGAQGVNFSFGEMALRIHPASAVAEQEPESVLARALVDQSLQRAAGRRDPLATTTVTSSEPGSRYIDFLIPGLLGMNLMNAAMWGIGFAIVDMRQRKLLKRFVATPMRRSDFLLALLSSRLLLMLIEVALLLGFGVLAFHMRILGSLWSILLIGSIGAISFGGLGLLTASRAQKIESASGLMNLVMMPMWIFSGVFFSGERFPAAVQPWNQQV